MNHYAADTDTPYVSPWELSESGLVRSEVCGFDAETLGWQPCFAAGNGQAHHERSLAGRELAGRTAMVGDSINNRLILMNPLSGDTQDFVWAVDLDTGEWTEILAPSVSGLP